jgi:hypothetical protein
MGIRAVIRRASTEDHKKHAGILLAVGPVLRIQTTVRWTFLGESRNAEAAGERALYVWLGDWRRAAQAGALLDGL